MFLPDQNQLYALYMFSCGEHGVGKPNKEMLELLAEDDRAWNSRLSNEAQERGVSVSDMQEIEADTLERQQEREAVIPLAMRRVFRLTPVSYSYNSNDNQNTNSGNDLSGRVHVGARGALAILDVIEHLPFLEELDFSTLTSFYTADAYVTLDDNTHDAEKDTNNGKSPNVCGNAVIAALCRVATNHPSLRVLDIRGHPLGTTAGHALRELLCRNRRVQVLRMDRSGIDHHLLADIDKELSRNVNTVREKPKLPRTVPDVIARLPTIDRKTVREQQLLRRLMEAECGIGDIMNADTLREAVLHARVMSTTAALTRSNGLRGDGVHLFLIKSGIIRAGGNPRRFELRRGDYFGDTYVDFPFPQELLEEGERGVVYAVPLQHCKTLCAAWARRIESLYPLVRNLALLQAVSVWTRLRICCCATPRVFHNGETVIVPGDSFKGFFLVTEGSFGVVGRTTNAPRTHVFTVGDIFGEESLVSRRECSSVTIAAARDVEFSSCLLVEGCGARVLHSHLQPVLMTLASAYSLHEDLQPIRA
ncbi:Cyclic nucleotide-binding domain [Trypanosoma melophagium]|uniref:Cyclic nucleotide-binding domain n=1 Tax=Trypanosoma melophagium TaxID=715481 RepID=UPI00351A6D74|nr:Cyclic nucleotide-binding domain [Trypanosoma melophagium]